MVTTARTSISESSFTLMRWILSVVSTATTVCAFIHWWMKKPN